ncbi:MAG: peptidylprolyl isomerase [Bacteroidetes bacterium]|nr:MAG: peptidylprolyl isomerase [Bacteroidota bacterium]
MNRKLRFLSLLLVLLYTACGPQDDHTYALISTDYGDMKVKLYNSTPRHRDNFIKLAQEGYYKDLLFHRVIPGFMIQGGDPNSRNAAPGQRLGMGGPGYTIPAEIGALHLRGALAAARTPNPEKASSGSQFYIVQGRPVDTSALPPGRYSQIQKELYAELGGRPELDFQYTVFGEVVEGLHVIDSIAQVPTGAADRPLQDVRMDVKILN